MPQSRSCDFPVLDLSVDSSTCFEAAFLDLDFLVDLDRDLVVGLDADFPDLELDFLVGFDLDFPDLERHFFRFGRNLRLRFEEDFVIDLDEDSVTASALNIAAADLDDERRDSDFGGGFEGGLVSSFALA